MSEAAFEYGLEFFQNFSILMGFAIAIYLLKQDMVLKAVVTLVIASFLAALSIELTEVSKNASYDPSIQYLIYNTIGFSGFSLFILLLIQRFNPSYSVLVFVVLAISVSLALYQSNEDPLRVRLLHGLGFAIGGCFVVPTIKWQFNTDAPKTKVFLVWLLACLMFSFPIYVIDYSGLVLER